MYTKISRHHDPVINGDVLFYFNVVRAQLLTWLTTEDRVIALERLSDSGDYRSWFEIIFWIAHDDILTSTKRKFKDDSSIPYKVYIKPHEQTLATEWFSSKSLTKHFKKHGRNEMGFSTEEAYLESALEFVNQSEFFDILVQRLN